MPPARGVAPAGPGGSGTAAWPSDPAGLAGAASARAGTLGRFGLVRPAESGWLLGPGCVRFRPEQGVDPEYLVYYLNGTDAQEWVRRNAVGTAVQYFSAARLRSMPIFLPDRERQAQIVSQLRPYQQAAVSSPG